MKSYIQVSILLLAFLLAGSTAFGQSKKIEKKVNTQIENLDSKLMEIDDQYKLTDAQKEKAYSVYLEGFEKMQENWKAKISKEEKEELNQPIRKEMNKAIRKEVLTKEQRKALSSSNKK